MILNMLDIQLAGSLFLTSRLLPIFTARCRIKPSRSTFCTGEAHFPCMSQLAMCRTLIQSQHAAKQLLPWLMAAAKIRLWRYRWKQQVWAYCISRSFPNIILVLLSDPSFCYLRDADGTRRILEIRDTMEPVDLRAHGQTGEEKKMIQRLGLLKAAPALAHEGVWSKVVDHVLTKKACLLTRIRRRDWTNLLNFFSPLFVSYMMWCACIGMTSTYASSHGGDIMRKADNISKVAAPRVHFCLYWLRLSIPFNSTIARATVLTKVRISLLGLIATILL